MRPLGFLVALAVLHAASALSEAEEIVKKRDLTGLFKYSGTYEVADVIIDHLCEVFPELRPPTDEEMIKLKSQTSLVLVQCDHHTDDTAAEWEEDLAESPQHYGHVSAKIKQLRKLGKRAFSKSKLNDSEKKVYKNEDGFLLYHIEEPALQMLEKRIADFTDRGLTREQMREEVDKIDWSYASVWYADDPDVQEEKAEKEEKANHGIDFSRVQEAKQLMMDYSSLHEVLEYVVNHLVAKYPELHPGSEDKLILLKRELSYYWGKTIEEKVVLIGQMQRSSKPLAEFPILSVALKKMMKIGKSLKPLNESEEELREKMKDDMYAAFKMGFPPMLKHLDEKKAFYKKSGMGERLIKKHVGSMVMKLIDAWHVDDPQQHLIDEARERVRVKYEL